MKARTFCICRTSLRDLTPDSAPPAAFNRADERGVTLIELVLVIMLIGAIMATIGFSTGTFTYWKQESFIRRLAETISFLHHQAVSDQMYYCLQFNYPEDAPHYYKVGILQAEFGAGSSTAGPGGGSKLAQELSDALYPVVAPEQELQPPPSFPSHPV